MDKFSEISDNNLHSPKTMTAIIPIVTSHDVSIVMPTIVLPTDAPIRAVIKIIHTAIALICVGKSITAAPLKTLIINPESTRKAEKNITSKSGCLIQRSANPENAEPKRLIPER